MQPARKRVEHVRRGRDAAAARTAPALEQARQLRRQVHLRLRLHCFSRGAANGVLHRVSVVTKGRRFAFLPFLYDDAAARIREENARYVGETGSDYRSGTG